MSIDDHHCAGEDGRQRFACHWWAVDGRGDFAHVGRGEPLRRCRRCGEPNPDFPPEPEPEPAPEPDARLLPPAAAENAAFMAWARRRGAGDAFAVLTAWHSWARENPEDAAVRTRAEFALMQETAGANGAPRKASQAPAARPACARSGCRRKLKRKSGDRGSPQRYCSPACKQADWRKRNAAGQRDHLQGLERGAATRTRTKGD